MPRSVVAHVMVVPAVVMTVGLRWGQRRNQECERQKSYCEFHETVHYVTLFSRPASITLILSQQPLVLLNPC